MSEKLNLSFIEDCLIAYKSGLYFDGAEGLRKKIDEQMAAIKAASGGVGIPEYVTVSQVPCSKYAQGWNDCVDSYRMPNAGAKS